jgi:AraC-like DNA-binding protein
MLPLRAGKISKLFAARISSGEGVGALLAQYLRRLVQHPEQYAAADARHLGNVAVDLIAATFAQQLDIETALPIEIQHRALRARIDDFIEQNLGHQDLTPQSVAAEHGISLRTLHRLFQAEETTVAELIRKRRLERCRRDLTNPLLAGRPIYLIAAHCGFLTSGRSNANFSNMFRTAYGMSPRDYREGVSVARGDIVQDGHGVPAEPVQSGVEPNSR